MQALLQWRRASHWSNFVPRILSLTREHNFAHAADTTSPPLRFYLAADSQEAYAGLSKRFPQRLLYTRRACAAERCDFRDCDAMVYSLADMLNLAGTKLILGSGWSSFSEVAAWRGGARGKPLPMQMAGRDFGVLVPSKRKGGAPRQLAVRQRVDVEEAENDLAGFSQWHAKHSDAEQGQAVEVSVQQFWKRPF